MRSLTLALLLIAFTTAFLIVDARPTNFLVCRSDCGETLIADDAVARFKQEGLKFGLIQNHGTASAPTLYTHNVHIGALVHVGLYAIGIESFHGRQLFTLLAFAIGLLYIFLTCQVYSGSNVLALIVLSLFCTSYWGVLGFAFNALRAWHFLAIFATLFHLRGLFQEPDKRRIGHIIGLVVAASIAFGCGYDLWVICGLVGASVAVGLAGVERKWSSLPRYLAWLAVIFAIPFAVRQVQIISVLGPAFWWQDIVYTVAIKVPGASKLIAIPPIQLIDEFYKAHSILRPPATPTNSAVEILRTAGDMFRAISIPRWGALSWTILFIFLLAGLWLAVKTAIRGVSLTSPTGRTLTGLLLPLSIGMALGLAVFAPFSLHVYLKHEFPLIAAPILIAQGLALYVLGYALMCSRVKTLRISAGVALAVLIWGLGAVHYATTLNGLQPNWGWVRVLQSLPSGAKVAMSAYWGPEFNEALQLNHLHIAWVDPERAKVFLTHRQEYKRNSVTRAGSQSERLRSAKPIGGQQAQALPDGRYFVYQPLARTPNYNFDAASPDCAWQDPIWATIHATITRKQNTVTFQPLMVARAESVPGSLVSIFGNVSGDIQGISKVELIKRASSQSSESSSLNHRTEAPKYQDPPPVYNCIYGTLKAWIRIPDVNKEAALEYELDVIYDDDRRIRIKGFRLEVSGDAVVSKVSPDAVVSKDAVIPIVAVQPSVSELLREFPGIRVVKADTSRSGYAIFDLQPHEQ